MKYFLKLIEVARKDGSKGPHTHTGLLIDVQPIMKDTAESLLWECINAGPGDMISKNWIDRALKLLEKRK